jgi:hypothetical protein
MSGHNKSVATLSKFWICCKIFGGKFRLGENVGDISDISDISAIYSTVFWSPQFQRRTLFKAVFALLFSVEDCAKVFWRLEFCR